MNEDFVSFSLAKKLKEKGHTLDTAHHYDDNGGIVVSLVEFDERCVYPCPEIHQVLKWLREEKKINVLTTPILKRSDGKFYWGSEIYDISGMPDMVRYQKSIFNQEGYNDAALASIEYCLDNLI